jgi:hypothetical protein
MDQFDLGGWLIIWAGMLFCWYLGYKSGQRATAIKLTEMLLTNPQEIKDLIDRARQEIEQAHREDQQEGKGRALRVEKQNSIVYLYAEDNGQFLAQADTLEAALALVSARFPDENFRGHVNPEQLAELGIKNTAKSSQ